MGKIEDARAALSAVENEISDLQDRYWATRRELWRLEKSTSEKNLARAVVLREVVKNLEDKLPFPRLAVGERRPPLQYKLEKAQADLKQLRQKRYALQVEVNSMEAQQAKLGDVLPELIAALDVLMSIYDRVGEYPVILTQRDLIGLRAGYESQLEQFRTLPVWKAKLLEYGSDDYEPPSERMSEVEFKFKAARIAAHP